MKAVTMETAQLVNQLIIIVVEFHMSGFYIVQVL